MATSLRFDPLVNGRGPTQPISHFLNRIIQGNSIIEMAGMPQDSVHLILSDIPYGISAEEWDVLHDNRNSALLGSSPAQEKAGSVFKKRGKPINGWSEADRAIPREYQDWCGTWAADWYRVLKPGASAFVFAGRRFSHRCVCALEDAGFSLKDILAWERPRAAHRAQRLSIVYDRRGDVQASTDWEGWRIGNLRPTFEPILWFTKPYKIGTTIADNMLRHGVGAYNETAFSRYAKAPENVLRIGPEPLEGNHHPTQKPVRLMQALIELTTSQGQIVLDPFAGSGTTALAANLLKRSYVAFELNPAYARVAENRVQRDLLSAI
jgi:site-specific DNA-methyltransferase (adenine-specific)